MPSGESGCGLLTFAGFFLYLGSRTPRSHGRGPEIWGLKGFLGRAIANVCCPPVVDSKDTGIDGVWYRVGSTATFVI